MSLIAITLSYSQAARRLLAALLAGQWLCMAVAVTAHADEGAVPAPQPAVEAGRRAAWEREIAQATTQIDQKPSVNAYSTRGDARFFLGQFAQSVADYDAMVELNGDLDASHWRRGIALFYAGQYEQAAAQFERYHSFDDVDRENGIWRYLCQHKAHGRDKARQGLLKYRKDDRPPFPDVYQLFEGQLSADELLARVKAAQITEEQQAARLFYAHLYIGLNEFVEGRPQTARKYLDLAARSTWPEQAGYGPHYMWRVAHVHRDLLETMDSPAPAAGK